MKTLKQLLIQLNACHDAIQWLQDKTIEQAVTKCERADWILWLACAVECEHRKLVLCGAICANNVRHLMTDERSIKCVDVAMAYGNSNVTKNELSAAKFEARKAVLNVSWGIEWDAAWAAATDSPRASACDVARALGSDSALKDMAEIVRPIIADELIQKVNNLLQ